MSGDMMPKEEYDFIKGIQDYMLIASNMDEHEAWDFGFRIWQFKDYLCRYINGYKGGTNGDTSQAEVTAEMFDECMKNLQMEVRRTDCKDGYDYLQGYNDGYYARGILDKAGVEIHIDNPRGFTLKSISDELTDCQWR